MAIRLSCFLSISGRRFFSFLLYLFIVGVKAQDRKITCSIEPVKLHQDTVLTCNFPEDLSVTQKEFTVYHYNKGPDSDSKLDCWWLKGSLHCTIGSDIEFNEIVSRTLNLTIRNVTSDHTGRYACQVNGYQASDFHTCDLKLKNGSDSCDITYDRSELKARLTCFSNKTDSLIGSNITVYRHVGKNKTAVAECMWEDRQPTCRVEKGYLFNDKVSSHVSIWILEATKDPPDRKEAGHSLEIGLTLGVLLLAALLTAGIIMFVRHKRNKSILCFMAKPNTEQAGEASQEMLEHEAVERTSNNKVTEEFKEYLLDKVKKMYPKYLESFYFVPPVYFNRGRYQKQCLEGHDVYVPDPPDPSDVRHDQAMQRVLHCLRRMAEQHEEQMFVLTQFKYEDYLNRPIRQYKRNHLPMPSSLKGVDKSVGCFDILIVHRHQGVLVLVVKEADPQDGEQDKEISAKLTEGLKQLKLAKRMVKHLLRDRPKIPKIQQAVILPNCNSESLSQVLDRSTNLEKEIREYLELNDSDDPTVLFLCAEHLSEPEKPWDVSLDVVKSVGNWWNKLMGAPHTDEAMTDDIYQSMITRFCGPATRSTLQATDGYKRLVLPKTLAEAVSLTGDLYRRQVLYPDMIKLLQEPKMFLAGPRSTGKTTMLTITGTKWLRSGKNVFIVKDSSSKGCSFFSHIHESLEKKLVKNFTFGRSNGHVIHADCDFSSEEGRDNCIKDIMSQTTDTKHLCVLIEAHPEGKNEKEFCEQLIDKAEDICLWIVSHDTNDCPVMGKSHSKTLTTALNCPPAVVREVGQKSNLGYSNKYEFPPPTDGPPVKHVYHSLEDHRQQSDCCWTCGNEVGRFLSEIFSEQESVPQEPKHRVKRNLITHTTMQTSSLRYKDVLIVFECSFKDDDNFLNALRHSNIPVRTLENHEASTDDDKTAYAMSVTDMQVYRPKRKIVVYVEMDEQIDYSEYKERALASCTSQLILVHCKET